MGVAKVRNSQYPNSWESADDIYQRKVHPHDSQNAWNAEPPAVDQEEVIEEMPIPNDETGGEVMNDTQEEAFEPSDDRQALQSTLVEAPVFFEVGMKCEARYWGFAKYY